MEPDMSPVAEEVPREGQTNVEVSRSAAIIEHVSETEVETNKATATQENNPKAEQINNVSPTHQVKDDINFSNESLNSKIPRSRNDSLSKSPGERSGSVKIREKTASPTRKRIHYVSESRSRTDSVSSVTHRKRKSLRDLQRQSSLSLHHWNSSAKVSTNVHDNILDELQKGGVPWWTSKRVLLAIICFLGFFCLYANRVNLSVAIVCMVKNDEVLTYSEFSLNTSNLTHGNVTYSPLIITPVKDGPSSNLLGCPASSKASSLQEGEFTWNKPLRGLLLGAFFWGYTAMQIPGGWLAERYGPRRVVATGMLLVSVLSMLSPVFARISPYFLLVSRVFIGVGEATMYPGAQVLWAKWSPPDERSRLVGFSFGGCQLGNALTFPVASLLCEYGFDGGWPAIFYVLGGMCFIWCFVWLAVVRDTPSEMPGITPQEKKYINISLGHVTADATKNHHHTSHPWKAIMTSLPVWAISVANFCGNYGAYMLLTQMPTYMKEILNFDIKSNGVFSMIPYLVFWLFVVFAGQFADFFISRDILTIEQTRKLCCSIGMFIPAIFLVAVGYMDCFSQGGAVVLLTLSLAFCGFQFSSFFVNHGDIAPKYAGTIFGVTNTCASIPGILAPYIVSAITTNKTVGEWQIAFYLAAAVYAIGAIFYIVFAKGRVLPWASDEETDDDTGATGPLKEIDEDNEDESVADKI